MSSQNQQPNLSQGPVSSPLLALPTLFLLYVRASGKDLDRPSSPYLHFRGHSTHFASQAPHSAHRHAGRQDIHTNRIKTNTFFKRNQTKQKPQNPKGFCCFVFGLLTEVTGHIAGVGRPWSPRKWHHSGRSFSNITTLRDQALTPATHTHSDQVFLRGRVCCHL